MRLVFGDVVLYDWDEKKRTVLCGGLTQEVGRSDWLKHFAGTLDQKPVMFDSFEFEIRPFWLKCISSYMAPEQACAFYYLPYKEIARYIGLDRRISGILVSELLEKCRVEC